ncbi:S-acyl fatty acid synthase thioesterase, medium chain-like isoform X2 [Anneissia japonica]|nr:S-acyl fatty acid synthase thioesterase, medium chain-like isoform X2 [Anneissia japonica]
METLLNCRPLRPDARIRLFCFPWAGGGTNFYANWSKVLPQSIEVCAIRLAGRESRFKDKLCSDMSTAVAEIANTLIPKFQSKPFAFFGHSMGAALAFEVSCYLKKYYGLQPVHLFVSGFTSPQSAARRIKTDWMKMSDEEFVESVRRIGGTPEEVLSNRDLMKIFMPPLRADFHLIQHYEYDLPEGAPPLSCPVSFTDGDKDKPHDIPGWSDITSGEFSNFIMPGGHFYLQEKENGNQLMQYIAKKIL